MVENLCKTLNWII